MSCMLVIISYDFIYLSIHPSLSPTHLMGVIMVGVNVDWGGELQSYGFGELNRFGYDWQFMMRTNAFTLYFFYCMIIEIKKY